MDDLDVQKVGKAAVEAVEALPYERDDYSDAHTYRTAGEAAIAAMPKDPDNIRIGLRVILSHLADSLGPEVVPAFEARGEIYTPQQVQNSLRMIHDDIAKLLGDEA